MKRLAAATAAAAAAGITSRLICKNKRVTKDQKACHVNPICQIREKANKNKKKTHNNSKPPNKHHLISSIYFTFCLL